MSANWLYQQQEVTHFIYEIIELEQNWQNAFSISDIISQLDNLVSTLASQIDPTKTQQHNIYTVIDVLIDELGYTGPGLQALPESSISNLSYCIMHRTGNETSLTLVFYHLLKQLGFNAILADINQDMVLVVKLSSSEVMVIDALTGATEYLISNDDVKSSLVSDIAAFVKKMPEEEIVKQVLTEQKLFLLEENMFEQALLCVETLMALLPEDPYERRDRGLVLNQLDCGQWAKEDFDYFVKACPNDPMAGFIKLQLEEQSHIVNTIH